MPSKRKLLDRIIGALTGRPNRAPESVSGSARGQLDYLLGAKYNGSTKALAKDLGVSQRHVQQIRAGKRAPSAKLEASLKKRATATYAHRSQREAKTEAAEWREQGAGGFGELRVVVDVLGSGLQIQGSPKVRGRTIMLDLTSDQAAELAAAKGPHTVHDVVESALLDYFNGVSPGHARPTFVTFSPGDIEFDLNGVTFE